MHTVPSSLPTNRTTMVVETRAGERSHSSERRSRAISPRPPEQQSGSDNNENCGYEVSGKSAMSMNVYMWGRGEDGQIGLGDTSDQFKPMLIESLKDVKEISCGSGHTVILTTKGRVFSWGRGDDGRLGHGDQAYKYVPRPVLALRSKEIVKITCGSYHTAAVTKSGKLYTWGGGMYGKLGVGNENGSSVPVLVDKLRDQFVINVACGSRHTVALTKSSEVYVFLQARILTYSLTHFYVSIFVREYHLHRSLIPYVRKIHWKKKINNARIQYSNTNARTQVQLGRL